MIIHSPETPMPPPYNDYIKQRAAKIADVLSPVVDETNVQLCPRAILTVEEYFPEDPDAVVYGCVVDQERDGYKTALYQGGRPGNQNSGQVVYTVEQATDYALAQFDLGNRVRFKDPRESDGQGQFVAATKDEATQVCSKFDALSEVGMVVMPHLAEIKDRLVFGAISLGRLWRVSLSWARICH